MVGITTGSGKIFLGVLFRGLTEKTLDIKRPQKITLKKISLNKKPFVHEKASTRFWVTIMHFFDGKSPSRHKKELHYLAYALMEHFL